MTAEGLNLKYSKTTYFISPWPAFKISYRNSQGEQRPIPLIVKPAILTLLNELRLCNDQAQRLAVYELVRNLPLWMHARLVPMRQYYWLGIDTLSAMPALDRVLEGSPALFAVIVQYADARVFSGAHLDALRILSSGRQRDLVRWLGLGDSEFLCKTLRKFPFYEFSYAQWRAIARNLRSGPVGRTLRHARSIPNPVLDFLSREDHAKVLTPAALGEAVGTMLRNCSSPLKQREYIDEILTFGALFRKFGISQTPLPSMRAYRELRDRSEELLYDLPLAEGPTISLPGIHAIRTARELKAEGQQMEHCAGSAHYVLECLRGHCCFYRVYGPARVTICLTRNSGLAGWTLDQIQGRRNSKISEAASALIRDALRQAGVETTAP